MATYFVASGGSNTSPYDTWAKAATSLATVLAAATSNGDIIAIQYNGVPSTDNALSADTTYTAAANISIISSTNSGTSTITPTEMDGSSANQYIGHSSLNRGITLAGAFKVYIYGVALLVSGSTADNINIGTTDGSHYKLEKCKIWLKNSGASARIITGTQSVVNCYNEYVDCDFWFGSTSQSFIHASSGGTYFRGCTINSSGSAPSTLIEPLYGMGLWTMEGCDLSKVTGTLLGNQTNAQFGVVFVNCKLGNGVTPLASQTGASLASGSVWTYNCASDDTHWFMGHYNALGQTTVDTGIYANDGATYDGTHRHSWKIVTSSAASYYTPYVSPWFDKNHTGTSAITPSLEILRDGSSTAYKDDEVWGEFSYQGTSGYPISTIVSDRMALAGSAASQTTGALNASGWTGENATAWFGKLNPTSTITPAENPASSGQSMGHLRARVCVGVASSTVYVDPTLRGTS
jgi:hypothetical protein